MIENFEKLEKKYKDIKKLKSIVEPLGYSVIWKGENDYFLIREGKEKSYTFLSYNKKCILNKLFN